jgi:hypothetical protein
MGALLGAAAAALIAGCGGVTAPDLFVVERTGAGARLTLLIDEQGGLHCNGRRGSTLSDPQIVQARAIQEELATPASRHVSLPVRPGSVFGYYLRDESGSVSFADNSAGQPRVFRNLALFVLQLAQQNCHLPQLAGSGQRFKAYAPGSSLRGQAVTQWDSTAPSKRGASATPQQA